MPDLWNVAKPLEVICQSSDQSNSGRKDREAALR